MSPNKRLSLALVALFTVVTVTTCAAALPGPTACLLVAATGPSELSPDILADRDSGIDSRVYLSLVHEARQRIESTFGKAEAKPIVVFLGRTARIGPFRLNAYGSSQFVGGRACVMIGPEGRSVDVVAHELMHAELNHRVGSLNYFRDVPTWFDEGLAMQVDHGRQYLLTAHDARNSDRVRALTKSAQFFVADDEALTYNYASAKHEVAEWLSQVGAANLYIRLGRVRAGASFADAVVR
jgi:hypothetical protein